MKKALVIFYALLGGALLLLPAPEVPGPDALPAANEPQQASSAAPDPPDAGLDAAAQNIRLTRLYAPPVPGISAAGIGETEKRGDVQSLSEGGEAGAALQGVVGTANIPPAEASPQGSFLPGLEESLLESVNGLRQQAGCAPLKSAGALQRCARLRAKEMACSGCFSHTRPDGSPWSSALPAPETLSCPLRGEIFGVAQGASPRRAAIRWLQEWEDSPSEKENLCLPEFQEVGIGAYSCREQEEDILCAVLIFSGSDGQGDARTVFISQ